MNENCLRVSKGESSSAPCAGGTRAGCSGASRDGPCLCWPRCGSTGQRQKAAMPAWLLSLWLGTHLGVKERNV